MIITPVQKVKSCRRCPNFRTKQEGRFDETFYCLANMKKIGSSISAHSRRNVKNKISDLCPFANNEVNQRPTRGK